jgi:hypothetical protein
MPILNEYAPFIDTYIIDRNHEANELASTECERLLPAYIRTGMHFIMHDISQRLFPSEMDFTRKETELVFVAVLVIENMAVELNILRNRIEDSYGYHKGRKLQHIMIKTMDGLR